MDCGVINIAYRHFLKGNTIKPINQKIEIIQKEIPGNSDKAAAAREAAVEALQAAQSAQHDDDMDGLDGG